MALVNLALCSYELGDIETACQLLQQAVSNNPWNARAVADLANCFCALGQAADALELCTGRHVGRVIFSRDIGYEVARKVYRLVGKS